MQTVKLELEDTLYADVLKKGIDLQVELKKALHKILYSKEHKIANDINQSLKDLKDGKSKPLDELLSEV